MGADRPLAVVIAALGGQGGGVLAQWLAEAAHIAGYPAQVTSTPGVAQRTGATTYYFELFPDRAPESEPVFSLFPCSGDVDMVAALEPMEAARTLDLGYVTALTTVITARERVYAIGEKVVAGDGTVDATGAIEALSRAAGRVIALDVGRVASDASSRGNAVLFGAIVGTGVLPLPEQACRKAIEVSQVAVAASLAGFDAGLRAAKAAPRAPDTPRETGPALDASPEGFDAVLAALPAELRVLAGHAVARLVDYQGRRYAASYLKRLEAIATADREAGGATRGYALSLEIAQRLAAWMSFEDVIRVAELKTRRGRLARIRREIGAGDDEPVRVVDFLNPGRGELAGLLPPALGRLIESLPAPASAHGIPLRFPTSTVLGFATMKALAALKRWRPRSHRFRREQAAIESWLGAVVAAAHTGDYSLACQVAGLAVWARGYGSVRAAGDARLERVLSGFAGRLEADRAALTADVAGAIADARDNPDGHCRPQ